MVQSTRVVKIDIYDTVRPFKRTPDKKLTDRVWKFGRVSDKIRVKSRIWKVFGWKGFGQTLEGFRTKFVSSHPRPALSHLEPSRDF